MAKPTRPCPMGGICEDPSCPCHEHKEYCERFNASMIPAFLADATFHVLERDPLPSPTMLRAVQWLKAWSSRNPLPTQGIVLSGPNGIGKSFVMAALVRSLTLQRGVSCLFADFAQLLLRFKASYNGQGSEHALYDALLKPNVLVLDDVGSFRDSLWARDVFQTIIAFRYNACKQTFLTTNLSLQSRLDGFPGPFERWTGLHSASRLKQMCYWLPLDGPDRRRLTPASHHSLSRA